MTEKILDRVRKLLKLAQHEGTTEHEAAAAASAAQRLIEQHALDVGALDVGDAPPPPEKIEIEALDPEDRARVKIQWRGRLAFAVARSQGCRMYWWGSRIQIVGPRSRTDAVRAIYAYLARTVDDLGAVAARGRGRGYGTAWRVGCAARLGERLLADSPEARAQAQAQARATAYARGGEGALVAVSRAIERDEDARRRTEAIYEGLGLRRGRAARPVGNASGYYAGRQAAEGVRISGGPALGSGAPALKRGS